MSEPLSNYTDEFFQKLIEKYPLQRKLEDDDRIEEVVYFSRHFFIKIEKYFRELYTSVQGIGSADGTNLFNLLEYLKQPAEEAPKSNFFREEKDLDKCYRKQANFISEVIYENFELIDNFFSNPEYSSQLEKYLSYWERKHPELYNKLN